MVRPLDPSDPIDRAAMAEVDALYPAAAPITPSPSFDEAFKQLERDERAREVNAARRSEKRRLILTHLLGEGYYPDHREDRWLSRDGRKAITGAELCWREGRLP